MTRFLALVALVAAVAAGPGEGRPSAQARRLPPGAALLGQVVDAQTGRGLDRVVVEVDGAGLRRRLVTDSRGRFLFTGLNAGEYLVRASRSGYLTGSFGQRRATGTGTPVSVNGGQWIGGVDITLWRPAVITGDVRDDRGEPMVGVTVSAYKHDRLPAHATLRVVASAVTDDEGRYRLQPLSPGDHVVGISTLAMPAPDQAFPPQYYPGADRVAGAFIVPLEAGREFGGISFMLPSLPTFDVAGRIDLSGVPEGSAGSVRLQLARPRDPGVTESPQHRVLALTVPDAEGRFLFAQVPGGEYVIEASLTGTVLDEPRAFWATTAIALTDTPLDDVSIVLQPGLTVEGGVQVASRTARNVPPPEKLIITFEPLFDSAGAREASARIDATGQFSSAPVLLPGRYLVRVGGIPSGLMLRSVMSGGIDVSDAGLDLSSGFPATGLVVELTDQLTELLGTVRGTGPFADPFSTVLLFPERDGPGGARRIRSVRTNAEGTFTIRNLPAGSYLVAAIDDAQAEGWQTPERLQALRPRAAPVILREGETKVLELRRIAVR